MGRLRPFACLPRCDSVRTRPRPRGGWGAARLQHSPPAHAVRAAANPELRGASPRHYWYSSGESAEIWLASGPYRACW